MKFFHFAVLPLAAIIFAGCAPKNPPSGYPEETIPVNQNLPPPVLMEDTLPPRVPPAANTINLFDSQSGRYNSNAILTTVYFGFDKYNVATAERDKLAAIATRAKGTKIIVAGYADHFGTDQYNLALSDKRAQSVKNYLVKLGVPEGNIEVQAYGKQYARHGGTKAQVAEDRRADVVDENYGAR
ncbi:MAG: OmpA family protein [Puniceicoccales bacterium]|jgi:peptidoglycan-associated lipoprotein|nr:OmpA family protein [Puniceicoccales bacterium]